ncbi:MAG: TRAP transporter substrate-binding protein DctP [Bacteroidetes bacterium]|nr:TRAP transporter substrate-binding protein DctP [Bacteroidota bacterium]
MKIFLLILFLSIQLFAQQHIIKFATLAPEGSTWISVMREFDAAIRKESGGKLGFKIYPGGIAGDEKDVIRKIRLGQYHSAGITGVGMGEISPIVRILDTPFLFRNYSEVDFILQKHEDEFAKSFLDENFILLGWAEVGFVYTFSNNPIKQIKDLKGIKMWSWEGDPVAEATFKSLNANFIPLSITDVMTSLQTNLVDGFYTSPLAAISLQWFTTVKYMLDFPLANASGSIIISKKEFDKLTPDLQQILIRNGKIYMRKLTEQSREDNRKSLQSLKNAKIIFTQLSSDQEKKYCDEIGKNARKMLVGKLYEGEFLTRVENSISEFRQNKILSK